MNVQHQRYYATKCSKRSDLSQYGQRIKAIGSTQLVSEQVTSLDVCIQHLLRRVQTSASLLQRIFLSTRVNHMAQAMLSLFEHPSSYRRCPIVILLFSTLGVLPGTTWWFKLLYPEVRASLKGLYLRGPPPGSLSRRKSLHIQDMRLWLLFYKFSST